MCRPRRAGADPGSLCQPGAGNALLHYYPFGKPVLAPRSSFCFSLAHAKDRAVLAVAWQREVGVDLEACAPGLPDRHDLPALISKACTTAEATQIETLPTAERLAAFLRIWTLKEAYLKGIGAGLTREPRALEVIIGADGRAEIVDSVIAVSPEEGPLGGSAVSSWCLRLLTTDEGWVAALVVAGDLPQVSERSWPQPLQPA